ADLSLVKTLTTVGPFTRSEARRVGIEGSNAGPSTATKVAVSDTPSNLTITGVSGACAALPCSIASIASGANATITVTGTIDADGAFSNAATASADEDDPDDSNNEDDDGGSTDPSADLSLVKTLTTVGPFTVGQTVSFDIVVSNAGPSTATNVAVSDTPSNLTITGVSGACAALPCSIASIASGADATITVTATIDADGAFSNAATASADEDDPDDSNNEDDDGGSTDPSADLSLVKTLTTVGPFTVGQTVSFDIVVSNAGPSTATNVAVSDTPSNLTITGVSGACAALPCSIASIASGADATITVTATIDADGAFSNAATASADEDDPDDSNNEDDDGGSTDPSADLSLVKTLTTVGPFTVGQTVSFDIVVSNAGPSTATNVAVSDTPSNLTITGVSGACAALPCSIASIASGADATITVTATIDADGAFSNAATASADEDDPDDSNNEDDDGGSTDPSADLSIDKQGPSLFEPGTDISFTIVVTNNGPDTALNTVLDDPTPPGLTWLSNSGDCVTAFPCALGDIVLGDSRTITSVFHIDANYSGPDPLINYASVASDITDPTPDNDA